MKYGFNWLNLVLSFFNRENKSLTQQGTIMTIPQWTLLYFALWTLLTLIFTVGVMRFHLILTGKTQPKEFRADVVQGSPRYRQAIRAHANCVENLPVYGAIIFGLTLLKLDSSLLNTLAIIFIISRVCQTITHIALADSNRMVSIRFLFFFIQLVIMLWMIAMIIATWL